MAIKDRGSLDASMKGGGGLTVEDVFSTYVYTGNGTTQDIVNGIDLATDGGMVWTKGRYADHHYLFDTERGATKLIYSHLTNAETTSVNTLTSFNTDGFSVGTETGINNNTKEYASWTFRKAPRFFDVVKYTGNGVAGREIAHNLGCDVGMIVVKKTTGAASNWMVYHKSTTATDYLALNLTDASTPLLAIWNDTNPTDAVFSLGDSFHSNQTGDEYIAYLFADDPLGASGDGSDGMIACGSYVGDGLVDGLEIDLGWEPQYILIKSSTLTRSWIIHDTMRGITSGGNDALLYANGSDAEYDLSDRLSVTASGFKITTTNTEHNSNGATYIYMAIRNGLNPLGIKL